MEESIFEIMEQNRTVDHFLYWLAVIAPLVVAGIVAVWHKKPFIARNRHHWVLGAFAAPLMLIMWKIYNAVVDHYGLDSIFGLYVNVAIFAAVTVLLIVVRAILYRWFNTEQA